MSELHEKGLLAVGNRKNDFGNPDGLYVFVIKENKVNGVYCYTNGYCIAINSKEVIPEKELALIGKEFYWVIESADLVKKE